jgi:hypothetical protein
MTEPSPFLGWRCRLESDQKGQDRYDQWTARRTRLHRKRQGTPLMFSDGRSIIIAADGRVNPTDDGWSAVTAKMGLLISRPMVCDAWRVGVLRPIRRRGARCP